jgi:hypothetical protein
MCSRHVAPGCARATSRAPSPTTFAATATAMATCSPHRLPPQPPMPPPPPPPPPVRAPSPGRACSPALSAAWVAGACGGGGGQGRNGTHGLVGRGGGVRLAGSAATPHIPLRSSSPGTHTTRTHARTCPPPSHTCAHAHAHLHHRRTCPMPAEHTLPQKTSSTAVGGTPERSSAAAGAGAAGGGHGGWGGRPAVGRAGSCLSGSASHVSTSTCWEALGRSVSPARTRSCATAAPGPRTADGEGAQLRRGVPRQSARQRADRCAHRSNDHHVVARHPCVRLLCLGQSG